MGKQIKTGKYTYSAGILAMLCIGCLILFYTCGKAGADVKENLSGQKLKRAEEIMLLYPDSALFILQQIDTLHLCSREEKALYSLLYSQALDKNYIDIASDSIIRNAVKYYAINKDFPRMAQAFYYSGIVNYNAGLIGKAVKEFIKAKEAYQECSTNYYTGGQINNTLGMLYFKQKLYKEAIELYKESARCFEAMHDKEKQANALSYIAKCHYLAGDDSLAVKYHNMAIELYTCTGNNYKILLNKSCIADIFTNRGETDKAVELLQDANRLYCNDTIPLRNYPLWSRIYLKKGNLPLARKYATKFIELQSCINSTTLAGVFLLLREISLEENDYKEACLWEEKYITLKNAIDKEKEENHIREIEAEYTAENLLKALENLEKRHGLHKIVYTGIIFILFIISIAAICKIILSKRDDKALYEEQKRQLHYINENLKEHLNEIQHKYSSLLLQREQCGYSFKDDALLNIYEHHLHGLKELIDTAYTCTGSPEKFYNGFKKYIKTEYGNESVAFTDLHYIVNKTHYGIIDYLKSNYPALTNSDLNYCSMVCLGFSNNAIRMIYGHTNTMSIYNRRRRILNRLAIKNSTIEAFLAGLSLRLASKSSSI